MAPRTPFSPAVTDKNKAKNAKNAQIGKPSPNYFFGGVIPHRSRGRRRRRIKVVVSPSRRPWAPPAATAFATAFAHLHRYRGRRSVSSRSSAYSAHALREDCINRGLLFISVPQTTARGFDFIGFGFGFGVGVGFGFGFRFRFGVFLFRFVQFGVESVSVSVRPQYFSSGFGSFLFPLGSVSVMVWV